MENNEFIKVRDRRLDLFKGLLLLQMTLAHVLSFFGEPNSTWYWVSQAINVSTFGGFVFAFAWGAQLAWFPKGWKLAAPRIGIASIRIHFTFLLSALAYWFIVDHQHLDWDFVIKNLSFGDLPNYSQFLPSFTLFTLIALLFFPLWKKLPSWVLLALAALSIASTLIEPFHNNIRGSFFWGSQSHSSFPVLQYMHYWLLGLVAARHNLFGLKLILPAALLGSALLGSYIYQHGEMPREFAPTIWWITGGYGIHLIYLQIARLLAVRQWAHWLSEMGSKILYYLLLSNVLVFALSREVEAHYSLWTCGWISAGILAACYWSVSLAKKG